VLGLVLLSDQQYSTRRITVFTTVSVFYSQAPEQHCTINCTDNTVQYRTVQYSTVQFSSVHYTTLHYTAGS